VILEINLGFLMQKILLFFLLFAWAYYGGPRIRPQAALRARPKPMAQPHISPFPFFSVAFSFKPVENSKNHKKSWKNHKNTGRTVGLFLSFLFPFLLNQLRILKII